MATATQTLGAAVLRLGDRLRSRPTLRVLEEIRNEPFVTPEEAGQRQLRRLRGLLEHCQANVPFYRQRFTELGFSPADVRTLADFAQLAPLTKADVAANADAMIATNVRREALLAHHSGGSTGVPLRFYRDMDYVVASEAGTYRNLLQSGWRPGGMIAFFWGFNDRLTAMGRPEFVLRQHLRRMYQFDPFRSGEEDMERWWHTWRRLRPQVALGYASTIARYARFLRDHGYRPPPLRGVFTTAEKLFPQQRAILEEVFQCRVFDCYGSSEVQNIAAECPRGRMHIAADYVIVETVADEAAADGTAPLLVTSLRNFAMPFLRYRNEDRGSLVDGTCDCGSGFPLMSLNVARVSDNFLLPDGRVVHGEFFTHLLYGSEGVDSFQFHQVAPDRIILRYVPAGAGEPTAALKAAAAQVEDLAPGRVRLEIEAVDSIPLSSAGKHRFTRSDVVS